MTKPITISVPDGLSAELKKFPGIKVSAVCQGALKKQLEDLKSQMNKDDDLLAIAEKRFKEELIMTMDEYKKVCEEAGASWAAREASLEDLKLLEQGDDISAREAFVNSGCIPMEIYDLDELGSEDSGSENLWNSFHLGALNMWEKIKERMRKEGFSDFF